MLDLIPLAGATLAAIIVSTVVFIETDWLRCLIVIVFFVAYQQFENHVLQPLVYGRTVQLSPLAVLCAVLIGAQLAGILGALLAIPVAGSLLAIAREIIQYRQRDRRRVDLNQADPDGLISDAFAAGDESEPDEAVTSLERSLHRAGPSRRRRCDPSECRVRFAPQVAQGR